MIALEVDGEATVGVITSPMLGRRWWAQRGCGAFTSAPSHSTPVALAVSSTSRLSEAKGLVLPPIGTCPDQHRNAERRLIESGILVDGAWNHAMRVAEGSVDVSVHIGGGPWDHAAVVVIVEEAGGRFTDLWAIDESIPGEHFSATAHATTICIKLVAE